MTALCLCNNISRHIKITSTVLNFVTEICSNFLELKKKSVWVLNVALALRSNFLELKIMFLYSQNEDNHAQHVQNNVKFYTKPILLLS